MWVIIGILAIAIGAFIDLAPVILIIVGVFILICAIVGISENIESKKKERERNHAESIKHQINDIITKYTPTHTLSVSPPTVFSADAGLLNREIINTAFSYKAKLIDLINEKVFADQKLNAILKHNEHETQDEYMLNFLINKEAELIELKNHSDELDKQIESQKIELLNESDDLAFAVKTAFTSLLYSKKCISTTSKTDVKKFVTKNLPRELSMFRFDCAPTVLFIESFYFCLFNNSILVFDSNGSFSTALDPTALKVHLDIKQTQIHFSNNRLSFDQYTASDSKCIHRGETHRTWLYTRADGLPDLRYRDNPRIDYRTDTYEYVALTISIASKTISFNASSHNIESTFNAMIPEYIRRCNDNKHDPIPELLTLLKGVSNSESSQIDTLVDISNTNRRNFFCKIIDMDR